MSNPVDVELWSFDNRIKLCTGQNSRVLLLLHISSVKSRSSQMNVERGALLLFFFLHIKVYRTNFLILYNSSANSLSLNCVFSYNISMIHLKCHSFFSFYPLKAKYNLNIVLAFRDVFYLCFFSILSRKLLH